MSTDERRPEPGELTVLSARDLTTERIRAMIHSGELQPGVKISIDDIAERFGVSRTPVRDAMWELSGEGLVEIRPRVGVRVRRISAREVLEVYAFKGALEPMMATWAAERGTAAQKEHFLTSTDSLLAAVERHDVTTYVDELEDRRRQLLDMAGSSVLRDLLAVIDGRVRLLRFQNLSQPGRLARSAKQHALIAKAVHAGDGPEARHLMHHHMLDAEMSVRRLLEEQPNKFADQPDDEATGTTGRRRRGARP